jgi:hypothetical protein
MDIVDNIYEEKPTQKFYFVESIIRIPLMTFIS